MRKGFWLFRGIKFVIFLCLYLLIAGFITMNLWNWLVPELFHGPLITFWQTAGLLVLSKILFGGFGKRGFGHRREYNRKCSNWKEKMEERMKGMSEEEREKVREKFGKKFNFTVNI
ncbi:MAG: hypothetical protein JST55_04200 [Bacteroidetes bacterium]|nr:hypothetical protein [Bacteroidota bacterium]